MNKDNNNTWTGHNYFKDRLACLAVNGNKSAKCKSYLYLIAIQVSWFLGSAVSFGWYTARLYDDEDENTPYWAQCVSLVQTTFYLSSPPFNHFYPADTRPAVTRVFSRDNLVLSTGLIMWIGHRKEIRKLTFRALALRRSETRNCGLCVVYTERWSYAIGWCLVTWKTTE